MTKKPSERLKALRDLNVRKSKIQDITDALISSGYASLDQQAKAPGLHRATAWTIIRKKHKVGRLSAKTLERITTKPKTPPRVLAAMPRRIERIGEQTSMLDIITAITAAAKPPAPKTATTKHLAYALAEKHQFSKKQGLEMMEELVRMITKQLKKGARVKITGLGIQQVRKRAARMGRNPATDEQIHIKASKKVAFRATKVLKDAI